MVIGLKDYHSLEERPTKSNKQLLDFMDVNSAYTTTDLQKFLSIQHPATLQRLKRLTRLGYLEIKVIGNTNYWHKLQDWPDEESDVIMADVLSTDRRIHKSQEKERERNKLWRKQELQQKKNNSET